MRHLIASLVIVVWSIEARPQIRYMDNVARDIVAKDQATNVQAIKESVEVVKAISQHVAKCNEVGMVPGSRGCRRLAPDESVIEAVAVSASKKAIAGYVSDIAPTAHQFSINLGFSSPTSNLKPQVSFSKQLQAQVDTANSLALSNRDKAIAVLDRLLPKLKSEPINAAELLRMKSRWLISEGDREGARRAAFDALRLVETEYLADKRRFCEQMWTVVDNYSFTLDGEAKIASLLRSERVAKSCAGDGGLDDGVNMLRVNSLLNLAGFWYAAHPKKAADTYERMIELAEAIGGTGSEKAIQGRIAHFMGLFYRAGLQGNLSLWDDADATLR
jgi:hypothetical protein